MQEFQDVESPYSNFYILIGCNYSVFLEILDAA